MPTYFDDETGRELKAAFEDVVSDWAAVEGKTMFGCPSYTADGTLFAVLVTDAVAITRLPPDRREELEATVETGPFRAGDRTVTKWVQIPRDDPAGVASLGPFVRASYETALAAA